MSFVVHAIHVHGILRTVAYNATLVNNVRVKLEVY